MLALCSFCSYNAHCQDFDRNLTIHSTKSLALAMFCFVPTEYIKDLTTIKHKYCSLFNKAHSWEFNSLPKDKILALSKLKLFADDRIDVVKNDDFSL